MTLDWLVAAALGLMMMALTACESPAAATGIPSPPTTIAPTASPESSRPQSEEPSPTAEVTSPDPTSTIAETLPIPVSISQIQMMDMKAGWAEGTVGEEEALRILRTEDSGESWTDVTPGSLGEFGRLTYFLDNQTAWAQSSEREGGWRTVDGGTSWSPASDLYWLHYIHFLDPHRGWKMEAMPWGLTFRQFDIMSLSTTQDGGRTWEEVNEPPGFGTAFMAYPDELTAWAIRAFFGKTPPGEPDMAVPFFVHATSDRGETWISHEMPLPNGTYPVKGYEGGTVLGEVGNCNFISPVYSSTVIWKMILTCESDSWMYTSTTGGKTWIINELPDGGPLVEVEFIDPSTGWIMRQNEADPSQGHLFLTMDGGESWTFLKATGWNDVQLNFLDAQNGWAVASAEDDGSIVTALVKTTDGGSTWQIIDPYLSP